MSNREPSARNRKRQTPEERAAKVQALQSQLAERVASLTTSEDWTAMLATAARFHRYSPNNVFLIMEQRSDATKVAGFGKWLSMGRHVRKGEKGIAILAPCRYSVEKDDGERISVLRGFKVEHVFDISQTEGDDIPDVRPTQLTGEAPDVWHALVAACEEVGYQVDRGQPSTPTANGSTDPLTHVVIVRNDLSHAQATKTLIHELAHIRCGHVESMSAYAMHRGRCEVEAESVAYVVAAALGFDTSGYSLPYVATWADGNVELVHKTAETVVRAAHDIITPIRTNLREDEAKRSSICDTIKQETQDRYPRRSNAMANFHRSSNR